MKEIAQKNRERKRTLYQRLAGSTEAVLLREPARPEVFVIDQKSNPNHEDRLLVPPKYTEVIGWFNGREVVRLR